MGAGGVGTMICTAEAVLPAQRGGAGRTSLSSCSVPQAPSTMLGSKAASTGGGGGGPEISCQAETGRRQQIVTVTQTQVVAAAVAGQ